MERRRNEQPEAGRAIVAADDSSGTDRGGEGSEQDSSSNERVARRAYQRFEERGGEHGRDIDDWLEAERELMHRSDNE
jgi:hypothetical protein